MHNEKAVFVIVLHRLLDLRGEMELKEQSKDANFIIII